MTHVIVIGTSEPQDFQLIDRGNAVAGAGIVPSIEASHKIGDVTTPVSGLAVAWLDAAAGKVRVTGVEALDVGTYLVRFKLTDSGGEVGFAPNGARADVWRVVAVPNS